jgi:hypothetical protein
LQKIEKDGGKCVCRDGLEGCNSQEKEEFINNEDINV